VLAEAAHYCMNLSRIRLHATITRETEPV
jgi:hypothetical protein